MYEKIGNYVNNLGEFDEPFEPDIGALCLVKFDDGYYRAQIVKTFCNIDEFYVRVFLCDSGTYYHRSIKDCIKMPNYLINFVPFLVGLTLNITFF